MTSLPPLNIPVLLLKTRSQPHDTYEEYFSSFRDTVITNHNSANDGEQRKSSTPIFLPEFVPVLEHRPNVENLSRLEELLKSGRLNEQYGGMIFTSQRAVEAWAEVVKTVEQDEGDPEPLQMDATMLEPGSVGVTGPSSGSPARYNSTVDPIVTDRPQPLLDDDFTFPLYTVGPATSRALTTLVTESSSRPSSAFTLLRPATFGQHTGNGDALAQYILHHYNTLHSQRMYTFYEAPRLLFTPLIGPPRGERIEKDDQRLKKKPLLFLVGEQRRDVIPRTLMDTDEILPPEERIPIDELEVYVTATRDSFQEDFRERCSVVEGHSSEETLQGQIPRFTVVVVFSPQGCSAMLRSLSFLDDQGNLTELAKKRWEEIQPAAVAISAGRDSDSGSNQNPGPRSQRSYIIATIGPTTRDFLNTTFGFETDVCAERPSPQGVRDGIVEFLREKGIL